MVFRERSVADLREFCEYMHPPDSPSQSPRTTLPAHGDPRVFEQIYAGLVGRRVIMHFSRYRRTTTGGSLLRLLGLAIARVSAVSAMPMALVVREQGEGPDPPLHGLRFATWRNCRVRLHSEAGVFGKSRFEETSD